MFTIDKKDFGSFLAELRKKKGMTQKELAEKLFVSDKAVSKWECGLSMPDIVLLKPLAELLDVTVTELLECRHIEQSEAINTGKVDAIIDKAIHFSEEEMQEQRTRHKKNGLAFVVCVLLGFAEIMLLLALGIDWNQIGVSTLTTMLLGVVFGIYFCFFAKEKIPAYYDEYEISAYSDGFFRMNMPGIRFNNSNWKHILQVGRIWSMLVIVCSPMICLLANLFLEYELAMMVSFILILTLTLGGLFIPIYVVANKYE